MWIDPLRPGLGDGRGGGVPGTARRRARGDHPQPHRKRVMRVNQTRRARVLDSGQLNAVLFSADDLAIVRGEPAQRRRFSNLEILAG